jgi:hypothetical protein
MTNESTLELALEAKLKRMRLRLEALDQDTLAVKGVPASHRSFSKAETNLLIKRSTEGMPCVVCVDEDLEYKGADQALAQAFAAGPTQQGWRILAFSGCVHWDLSAALEYALDFLGADEEPGKASAASTAPGRRLLAAWAENLTHTIAAGQTVSTLFRDEEMEQVAASTLAGMDRIIGPANHSQAFHLQQDSFAGLGFAPAITRHQPEMRERARL